MQNIEKAARLIVRQPLFFLVICYALLILEVQFSVDIPKHAVLSLRAAKQGADSYTTGWFYKGYRLLAKLLPNKWLVKFVGL